MKYAISNIAWKPHENNSIYALMKEYGVYGLEIAPSIFLQGSKKPYEEIETAKKANKAFKDTGLELVSMQSLLFGATGLSLFDDDASREALFLYCKKAINFASALSIPNLVFGSPKNRIIPSHMDNGSAEQISTNFFQALGEYAYSKNTCIAIEANAKAYGTNFLTTTLEAIDLIKKVDSKGVKLNIDMGTMSLEKEEVDLLNRAIPYANHIHISEGFLAPIYSGNYIIHKERAKYIKDISYNKFLSIEMKSISEHDNQEHVKRALEFLNLVYL